MRLANKALIALGSFNGFVEGWALYAEQLADELGLYQNDLLGKVGYQHDALFRAVRLVVDTGLHHRGWTREVALNYYMDALGDKENDAAVEIERYCIWPGQACSYMVGKKAFVDLKRKAADELKSNYSDDRFHEAALQAGALPLKVLEDVVESYIKNAKPT